MATFTTTPSIKQLPDHIHWILMDDLQYQNNDRVIIVPKDFITDGASIPRFFWRIIGHPLGEYVYAAILHDWLCQNESKSYADKAFYEAMGVLGVPSWKRSVMFFACRMFHLFQK